MNPQTDLIDTPAARTSDPESSHLAAERNLASGRRHTQQDAAEAAVAAFPGSTSAELAQEPGLHRYTLARRLPECRSQGRVVRGPQRLCDVSDHLACTWWPVA